MATIHRLLKLSGPAMAKPLIGIRSVEHGGISLVQVVAFLILVAIAAQIGLCASDDCGGGDQCGGTSQASNHCHNCICVGATSHNVPTKVPSSEMSFLADRPEIVLCEAPPRQLFLPPRT